jgi:hypothetical protein
LSKIVSNEVEAAVAEIAAALVVAVVTAAVVIAACAVAGAKRVRFAEMEAAAR